MAQPQSTMANYQLSLRRSVQIEITTEPDMASYAQLNTINICSLLVSSRAGRAF